MQKEEFIAITGMGSISPLGDNPADVWQSYLSRKSCIKPKCYHQKPVPVAALSEDSEKRINDLVNENRKYRHLDKSVLMAIYASRLALKQTGWRESGREIPIGINIGSSRGATGLFEKYHSAYLNSSASKVPVLTSPTTTLGNISSWVGNDIQANGMPSNGPIISHSVTCSTAMHAIGNAIAWIKAGMADKFLAGAAEASLTGFTVAQMKALKIYSKDLDTPYPCRPCTSEENRQNTMALGEGAAVFGLEKKNVQEVKHDQSGIIAAIESFGYGTETISHGTSISKEGFNLQKAMKMALGNMSTDTPVDAVLMHAPGTILGDKSELDATRKIFGDNLPVLISNKWFIGHTFGASAALSLEYALLILQNNLYEDFPYPVVFSNKNRGIKKIMINAAGFGGNAASLIISSPNF